MEGGARGIWSAIPPHEEVRSLQGAVRILERTREKASGVSKALKRHSLKTCPKELLPIHSGARLRGAEFDIFARTDFRITTRSLRRNLRWCCQDMAGKGFGRGAGQLPP